MIILAIDPGTVRSAWLVYDEAAGSVANRSVEPNADLLERLRQRLGAIGWADVAVIEQVASYGMPVGREVFETVHWAGRFAEAVRAIPVYRVPRLTVKMALCHSARADDSTIRRALLDRFGGDSATGRKATPGPLYGIHGDLWAALAVAVTWADMEPDDRAAARLR